MADPFDDYIRLGQVPEQEECTEASNPEYATLARVECKRLIQTIKQKMGPAPKGTVFGLKWFKDDENDYLVEAVIWYDENNPEALAYALLCEENIPATWNDITPVEPEDGGAEAA